MIKSLVYSKMLYGYKNRAVLAVGSNLYTKESKPPSGEKFSMRIVAMMSHETYQSSTVSVTRKNLK